jgi:hypothetical protein
VFGTGISDGRSVPDPRAPVAGCATTEIIGLVFVGVMP